MFARHTQTRMKGSAVVQGLKSWASRLHPQLPLSVKESQRLLTALTSSFRHQLDKAHPSPSGGNEGKPKTKKRNVIQTGFQGLHSSAAHHADKHLASVLTNPLLTKHDTRKKPKLDYTSAKLELHKNPAKDPILVLEEYHERGAATVPIASLCLETFKQTVDGMSPERRRKAVTETEAGKRTLLWLWRSKLYDTDAFVDDTRLGIVMVPFIVEEGYEEFLWDWLQRDQHLGSQDIPTMGHEVRRRAHLPNRWKGRILRQIVDTKLRQAKDHSVDSALDAFFRACDIKEAAVSENDRENSNVNFFPVAAAGLLLHHTLTTNEKRYAKKTDPVRYDRFIDSCDQFGSAPFYIDHERAQLRLYHPKAASPLPMLESFKAMLAPDASKSARSQLGYYQSPKDDMTQMAFFKKMIETIAQLRGGGLTKDAEWLTSHCRQWFPSLAQYIEGDIKEYIHTTHTPEEDVFDRARPPAQVPFPIFV